MSDPKVYVHIGLPKTATSTLQYEFFPNFHNCDIRYVGARAPRRQTQSLLFQQFDEAVRLGKGLERTNILINSELEKGSSILLSDELYLVSHNKHGTWREKIARLSKLLKGCPYVILVTVREPAAAAFSYYVELYHNFRRLNEPFPSLVRECEAMEIYHYGKLIHTLEAHFKRECLRFIPFEKIINNDLEGFTVLPSYDLVRQKYSVNSHRNYKTKDSDAVHRQYSETLGSKLREIIPRMGALRLPASLKRTLLPAVLPLYRLRFNKSFVIQRPSDSEMHAIRRYLADETASLKDFGVDYSDT